MKNRLIVISAGDYGREVAWLARMIPASCRSWEFAGFLDAREKILIPFPGEGPLLGAPETYEIQSNDRFICAIGYARDRLQYSELMESRGAVFENIIHPGAFIGDRTTIGAGCILWPNVMVTTDIQVGNHVSMMSNVVVGHDARIGDGAILSAFSFVGGHAVIGRGAFLAPHACVLPRKKAGEFSTVGVGSASMSSVKSGSTVFGLPARVIVAGFDSTQ